MNAPTWHDVGLASAVLDENSAPVPLRLASMAPSGPCGAPHQPHISVFMTSSAAVAPGLVSARDVSKTFGARKALNGVSVEVAAGEMVALIGPSGSGKSTLLRSITGLQSIDAGAGQIDVFGVCVQKNGRTTGATRAARAEAGHDLPAVQSGRTAAACFPTSCWARWGVCPAGAACSGPGRPTTRPRAMAALHRVGVSDYAAQRANTLSGGQQQRGAIARALVQGAKAILADEPVASLDPVSARKVMEILVELNQRDGLGVIVTLHQVDYAIRYCERVIALKAGKIVYDGPSTGLDTKQSDRHLRSRVRGRVLGSQGMTSSSLTRRFGLIAAATLALGLSSCGGEPTRRGRSGAPSEITFSILSAEGQASAGPAVAAAAGGHVEGDRRSGEALFRLELHRPGRGHARRPDPGRLVLGQVGGRGHRPRRRRGHRPHRRSGRAATATSSTLIVKAGSGITLDDVLACGKRYDFGIGDAQSTSGTLAPMAFLFNPRGIVPAECFKTVRAANHQANAFAVADGHCSMWRPPTPSTPSS